MQSLWSKLIQEPLDVGARQAIESIESKARVFHDHRALDMLCSLLALDNADLVDLSLEFYKWIMLKIINSSTFLQLTRQIYLLASDFVREIVPEYGLYLFQLFHVASDECEYSTHDVSFLMPIKKNWEIYEIKTNSV